MDEDVFANALLMTLIIINPGIIKRVYEYANFSVIDGPTVNPKITMYNIAEITGGKIVWTLTFINRDISLLTSVKNPM